MRKQKIKQLEENSVTSSAFTGDLETLMDKANNVIKIIDRYAKDVSAGEGNGDDEVQNLLESIGVTNMGADLDRSSSTYHTTLARLVADFLRPRLATTGGR